MHHSILLVVDLDEFAKSATVVVMGGFGIAECLQHWAGTQYGLLNSAAMRALLTEGCQVVQQKVRRLSLAGATLTTDDDALISLFLDHAVIGYVCYSKYVGRYVRSQSSVLIELDVLGVVNGIKFEGIEGNQDTANVGVNVAG